MLFSNQSPSVFVGILVALVVGITFHEFTHALVADRLGDHRPRSLGRVSLNPLHHLDPMGAIFFLLAGFGWGKPVPVNSYALRPGRIGLTVVALGGPIANFAVAIAVAIVFRVLLGAGLLAAAFPNEVLQLVVYFNVALGLFNLIPIPPLDGSKVLYAFLDPATAFRLRPVLEQYGALILLAAVFFPVFGGETLIGLVFRVVGGPLFSVLTGLDLYR